jgi:Protein of unknown function (DUF1003)
LLLNLALSFQAAYAAPFIMISQNRIERYLGFSPDHGDGSLEAILLMALITIITSLALGFFRKHHVRRQVNRN